jgi:hypothetical protein
MMNFGILETYSTKLAAIFELSVDFTGLSKSYRSKFNGNLRTVDPIN